MKSFNLLIPILCLCILQAQGQTAKISEQSVSLQTYPFSDPDPTTILTENAKIYPYFKFHGYSHSSEDQDWQVVTLENDHIEVTVLPEVGGKVWGAIEKRSGHEFIYRNEVMKFRNISMRGPWTSGGIEFNFGIIGHHPSTATPVDYVLEEHDDGSVSCTVGNIDLPSRTQWRVKIILPKDRAAFITEAHWYNPSPVQQAYYNWMTAAAPAQDDLEFYTPGDQYLQHDGAAKTWPNDSHGRNLALYNENRFGPSKSYHVVGEYNDFFGGYFHNDQYGFGHWSEYEEIPGQKLWLWALSRSGGIWEDLLTDTDGQYIEWQAGRLFVQYSPGVHDNPVTQATFEPHMHDQWTEIWFPIEKLGGLSEASDLGAMYVEQENNEIKISVHPFIQTTAEIIFTSSAGSDTRTISVAPLDVVTEVFSTSSDFTVDIPALNLHFKNNPEDLVIDRPFDQNGITNQSSTNESILREAREAYKFREFELAYDLLNKILENDPNHLEALVDLAEIHFRQGEYQKSLALSKRALQLDTYHHRANYQAGITYRAMQDMTNAKEALGWAARGMAFRSNAYGQIAEIILGEGDYNRSLNYANKSLDFNRYNLNALQVMAIAHRVLGNVDQADQVISQMKEIDPINHFMRFEQFLLSGSDEDKNVFLASHRSEFPYQTFLELSIDYVHKGRTEEALQVLELAPQHPIIDIWWCYLKQDPTASYLKDLSSLSPEFVFPFRRETLDALNWAIQHNDHWILKYYLGLNLWGKNRLTEAADLFRDLEDQPDYAPFYRSRANLLERIDSQYNPSADLEKAIALNPNDWRNGRAITTHYKRNLQWDKALGQAKQNYSQFPENYTLGMDVAECQLELGQYQLTIEQLQNLKVLPFEGASFGRRLYERAHIARAIEYMEMENWTKGMEELDASLHWPESLGVGKPFDPDERIADYLMAICHKMQNNEELFEKHLDLVIQSTYRSINRHSLTHLLGLMAHRLKGEERGGNELLNLLLTTPHRDSPGTQWVAAKYLGNEHQAVMAVEDTDLRNNYAITLLDQVLTF